MLGKAALIVFAEFGVEIDNLIEDNGCVKAYISVPEYSFRYDSNNNCMCGEFLAKKFKDYMVMMGIKNFKTMFKIRKGEYWTQEMSNNARENMKKYVINK